MTAIRNNSRLIVYGTGNTLASITSDINDTSVIEETSTGYYLIKHSFGATLRLYTDAELTIGDPTDFSVAETLAFENLSNARARFEVYAGSKFHVYGNSTLILATGSASHYCNTPLLKGEWLLSGSSDYPVTMWGFRQFQVSEAGSVIWNHVNVGKSSYRYNNMFRVNNATGIIDVKNCNMNTGEGIIPLYDGRFLDQYNDVFGKHVAFFDNCDFTKMKYPRSLSESCVKISNSIFSVNDSNQSSTPNIEANGFTWVSGSTFTADSGSDTAYGFESSAGMNILVEGCEFTWQPGTRMSRGLTNTGLDERLMFKDVSFASPSYEKYSNNSGYAASYVNRLTPTVVDISGSPIQGAKIVIAQIDNYESWTFETNSSGQINAFNYPWILATHYRKYGDYPNFLYDYKSDAVNGGGHSITVTASGYRPYNKTWYMSEDREIDILLIPLPKRHTNNSVYNKLA